MKFTVDLSKPVMDLSDDPKDEGCLKATDQSLGKVLATLLKSSNDGDALKFLCWAIDLYRCGKLEVDEADLLLLENFVKGNKSAWALVKGQLLQAFNAARAAVATAAATKAA